MRVWRHVSLRVLEVVNFKLMMIRSSSFSLFLYGRSRAVISSVHRATGLNATANNANDVTGYTV